MSDPYHASYEIYMAKSVDEAYNLVWKHEVDTGSKYCLHQSHEEFRKPDLRKEGPKVLFQYPGILYCGVPFFIHCFKRYICYFGNEAERNKSLVGKRKKKGSKETGCPAQLLIKEVIYFPSMKINKNKKSLQEACSKRIRDAVKTNENLGETVRKLVVYIPRTHMHKNHPVVQSSLLESSSVDHPEGSSVRYIDGTCLSPGENRETVMTATRPLVFVGMIETWAAFKWTLPQLCSILFPDLEAVFKVCVRNDLDRTDAVKMSSNRDPDLVEPQSQNDKTEERLQSHSGKKKDITRSCEPVATSTLKDSDIDLVGRVAMETDCLYISSTFETFYAWIQDRESALSKFPRSQYSLYSCYNYMPELFKDFADVSNAVDWSSFGFPGRNSDQSTIWVGSDGSFTPCHQDTYGCNLVAQIYGRKRWLLFPPNKSNILRAARLPYEESSVFTDIDVKALIARDGYTTLEHIEVVLQPGQVLLVPKHWWHFVECIEPSVSINTWIERDDDRWDRLKEAVVKTLVCGLKDQDGSERQSWLNPNQEFTSVTENLSAFNAALRDLNPATSASEDLPPTADFLLNCITADNVLSEIAKNIAACKKFGVSATSQAG